MPRLHESRRRTNATHTTAFAAGYCCRDSRCSHARASVRAGEAAEGNSSAVAAVAVTAETTAFVAAETLAAEAAEVAAAAEPAPATTPARPLWRRTTTT